MKTRIITIGLTLISSLTFGQTFLDSTMNSATKKVLFADPNVFSIGSYGEAHYNQNIMDGEFTNGNVDLHRVILFMGYKFNNKLQFFSEIEFEHVKEVYVEQAFMNYSFNSLFNLKAGIILIPMGYVNEFHEPTLFNGVERPNVDKYMIPTTWREMGVGFHGLLKRANLKYQLYMVNGFNGYNGSAKFNSSGLRSGRQKGAEAIVNTPAFTGKVSFFGLNGLRLGLSGYYGTSESSMYSGLDREDAVAVASADSTRVGIAMASVNAHYTISNIQLTAVGLFTSVSNTSAYNTFAASNLANTMLGYYTEIAYRAKIKSGQDYPQLIPFVRYENYDTQYKVDDNITRDASKHKEELTAGLGFQITPGTIAKVDFQWVKTENNPRPYNVFNLGFGYWF